MLKTAVSATCAYEIAAIITGKTPTLSALCRQHRLFEAFLLAALVIHLHRKAVREVHHEAVG